MHVHKRPACLAAAVPGCAVSRRMPHQGGRRPRAPQAPQAEGSACRATFARSVTSCSACAACALRLGLGPSRAKLLVLLSRQCAAYASPRCLPSQGRHCLAEPAPRSGGTGCRKCRRLRARGAGHRPAQYSGRPGPLAAPATRKLCSQRTSLNPSPNPFAQPWRIPGPARPRPLEGGEPQGRRGAVT